jgi:hypothetical protein
LYFEGFHEKIMVPREVVVAIHHFPCLSTWLFTISTTDII